MAVIHRGCPGGDSQQNWCRCVGCASASRAIGRWQALYHGLQPSSVCFRGLDRPPPQTYKYPGTDATAYACAVRCREGTSPVWCRRVRPKAGLAPPCTRDARPPHLHTLPPLPCLVSSPPYRIQCMTATQHVAHVALGLVRLLLLSYSRYGIVPIVLSHTRTRCSLSQASIRVYMLRPRVVDLHIDPLPTTMYCTSQCNSMSTSNTYD